jgi:hypothetical protein
VHGTRVHDGTDPVTHSGPHPTGPFRSIDIRIREIARIGDGATGSKITIVTGVTVPATCTVTETQSGENVDIDVVMRAKRSRRASEDVVVCPANPRAPPARTARSNGRGADLSCRVARRRRYCAAMAGWLDSKWLGIAGYTVAAVATLLTGRREHRLADVETDLWPTFWFLAAGVLFAMAMGRAGDIGGLLADLGRREARAGRWYDERRTYQAIVVGAVGAIWLITVTTALWRVPERRRRYLPMVLVMFTLMCFAGIRLVSLHQVDSLLDHHRIGGVRVGTVVELVGLSIAIAMTFWQPRPASVQDPGRPWAPADTRSTPR